MKPLLRGPVVILGAGPTGLGAAYLLTRSGFEDWVLYEREAVVGGLARSFRDDRGFLWDIGGHVVFSHYDVFTRLLDDLLGPDGWIQHERECWVHVLKRWVPYPFQNNIHHLPTGACSRCLEGLIQAAISSSPRPPENFDEFIGRTFGEGIAELFMRPYNSKVWGCPLAKLNARWVGERVTVPDPVGVACNVVHRRAKMTWGPNNQFRFPARGGTGAVWEALSARLPADRVRLKREAVAINADARAVRFADGMVQPYGTLLSTVPLDRLVAMTGHREWFGLASSLMHSSTHVVGVALRGRPSAAAETKCWMYFPESRVPFYRVTHFSHYSPHNVPDARSDWSLMAEVSESPDKPVNPETVAADTVAGLVAVGLVESPDHVAHTWSHRVEYGYPTPSLGRDAVLKALLPALEAFGIVSRGRFGAWLYEVGNMDHSFMQGVEAAAHILYGAPELTVWQPDMVNQPHPILGWDRFRWGELA